MFITPQMIANNVLTAINLIDANVKQDVNKKR